MATNLRLTDAGRDAIIDPNNVGTQAVQITRLALGVGSGPGGAGDDGRAALRDQRDIEDVAGSTSVAGQVALRAVFNTATTYQATEMGLFARIGAGAEFLFAYWTDGGTVFINKPADLRTIVVATVAVVRSEADVAVTVAPDLTVSAVATLLDLTDSPGSYVNAARHKVVVNAAGTGVEFVSGLLPHEMAAADARYAEIAGDTFAGTVRGPQPPDGDDSTRLATTAWARAAIVAAVAGLVDSAPGALDTLHELATALGDDADFSATIMGLINARPTLVDADGRYLKKAGDTATGALRGPHPADDDKSDRFATTQWVRENAGGVGNVAFFSVPGTHNLPTDINHDDALVLTGEIEPQSATAPIGILMSWGFSDGSGESFDLKIQRGSADLTPTFRVGANSQAFVVWRRQLFIDLPGSAARQTYNFRVRRVVAGNAFVRQSTSMKLLALSDAVVADVRAARSPSTSAPGYREVASATIRVRSAAAKVSLRFSAFVEYSVPSGGANEPSLRLTRGGVVIAIWTSGQTIENFRFPSGAEDWVDEPGTLGNVTYALEVRTGVGRSLAIERGSFILADIVP